MRNPQLEVWIEPESCHPFAPTGAKVRQVRLGFAPVGAGVDGSVRVSRPTRIGDEMGERAVQADLRASRTPAQRSGFDL